MSEGDHIKVTASKYPFPTVCADKQSTDWFHAISRTLKWNERERQKSFVVVEEEAPKLSRRKSKINANPSGSVTPSLEVTEELLDDEEEDEVSEEEEDKYDIDDSSPEAESSGKAVNRQPEGQNSIPASRPRSSSAVKRKSKSRSRSRPPPMSGVNTPGRYSGPTSHPPDVSSRHVEFRVSSPHSSLSSPDSLVSDAAQQGTRDELHAPRRLAGRSRIPKDRHADLEAVKTPTPGSLPYGRGRGNSQSRPRSADQPDHRAFAVWGHDESDSNASDSESNC